MTTVTPSRPAVRRTTRPFGSSVRAESIKFWSLRSNRILVALAILFVPLNAVLLSISLGQRAESPDPRMHISSVDAVAYLDSVLWLQLLIAVIAVLAATSESGGRIGASFLAVPTRLPILGAKVIVVGLVSFGIGIVGAAAGLLLPHLLLSGTGVAYAADPADVLRGTISSGAYLGLIAAISLAVAIVAGNLIVALLAPLALYTIVPSLVASVGGELGSRISGYFPTIAGRTALSAAENPGALDSTTGFLVMVAWAVFAVVGAGLRYRFADG
jgi:hypothetical protein